MKTLYARSLVFLSSIILLAIIAAIINGFVLRIHAEERMDTVIKNDLDSLWSYIVEGQYVAMQHGITTLTRNREALKALKKSDREKLQNASMPTYRRMAASKIIEKFFIVDADANTLLSAPTQNQQLSDIKLVKKALQEQKITRGLMVENEQINISLIFPLYSRGKLIGAGIFQRTTAEALQALQKSANIEAFLISNSGSLIGTTNSQLETQINFRDIQPNDINQSQTINDIHFKFSQLAIKDFKGKDIASLIIARDETTQFQAERKYQIITYSIFFIAGIILLAMVTWSLKHTFRALNNVAEIMKKVTEGDLTQSITSSRKDEIGQLELCTQVMVNKLRSMLGNISDSTIGIADASEKVSVSSKKTHEDMSNQQAQTQYFAVAMGEMTVAISDVAKNAEETSSESQQANREAQHGVATLEDTVQQINGLANSVETAATLVQQLSNDAKNIEGILKVIGDIAEQTNLLALNAAIEAARAGEHGRGFAVVADEVRGLAARTQDSTSEIQNMIESLQNGVNNVVLAMDKGQTVAKLGVEKASESGKSLDKISAKISQMTDKVMQIASASEQQSAVASGVNNNIKDIAKVAEETIDSTLQLTMASESLDKMTHNLRTIMSQFTMPTENTN